VQETKNIEHRILVSPNVSGTIKTISSGKFTVEETVATLDNKTELKLSHKWPVRKPRPCKEKSLPNYPLVTGQRIFDTLFPIAKGGTASKVRVLIESKDERDIWGTTGVSPNIIEASLQALLDSVVFKLMKDKKKISKRS